MINVSEAYKTKIDEDVRKIDFKVDFYFDGEENPPETFTTDVIGNLKILEEAYSDSDSPLGTVSSNEIEMVVANIDGRFNSKNPDSDLYEKLKSGIKIIPYFGLDIDGVVEWLQLGVFYSSDILSDSKEIEATIFGNDKLYSIMKQDLPLLPIIEQTNAKELFEILFEQIGLETSDYEIDLKYNYPIEIAWYLGKTVGDTLKILTESASCNITATRQGQIKVESKFSTNESNLTLDDDNQLISLNVPQRYLKTYSAVSAEYTLPGFVDEKIEVLKIKDFKIPKGINNYEAIDFSTIPVYEIESILLEGASTSYITNCKYGSNNVDLTIRNDGESEKVDLVVYGYTINTPKTKISTGDLSSDKILKLENHLIQNEQAARNYSNLLVNLLGSASNEVQLYTRGNPAIEINDVITVNSVQNNIYNVDVVPYRIVMEFDGTLSIEMQCMSLENVIIKDWVYIGHGLYAFVERE